MKGMVAEALWESTFLTHILTLEWRSDAICGKIRSKVSVAVLSIGLCPSHCGVLQIGSSFYIVVAIS